MKHITRVGRDNSMAMEEINQEIGVYQEIISIHYRASFDRPARPGRRSIFQKMKRDSSPI